MDADVLFRELADLHMMPPGHAVEQPASAPTPSTDAEASASPAVDISSVTVKCVIDQRIDKLQSEIDELVRERNTVVMALAQDPDLPARLVGCLGKRREEKRREERVRERIG